MYTKFRDITNKEKTITVKKTKFTAYLNSKIVIIPTNMLPESFDHVDFIGNDKDYGDVFKAYHNIDLNQFTIYFGIKGDEFD